MAGIGAVSPAGWSAEDLQKAMATGDPLPVKQLPKPGRAQPFNIRAVPTPNPRPAFFTHPRLRRTSPIATHAVGAALEALGEDAPKVASGELRLGIILCVMSGCVNYSRRFYDETLREPSTASPLVFPETVFNAPASHLGAILGTSAMNYTLVGDPGTYLQGIALAAEWLTGEHVDGCLVVGAEEMDWLVTDAFALFDERAIISDGAGALYLRREPSAINETAVAGVRLQAVSDAYLYSRRLSRMAAARHAREAMGLGKSGALLCDGLQGLPRFDRAEELAWKNWRGARLSPKYILGEGLMACSAWQCVLAVQALMSKEYATAVVSVVGCNQQAVAARFVLDRLASL